MIVGVVFWYLFRNEIDSVVRRWVSDSSWSHGFLIPFFSLYFLNQRKEDILNVASRPNYLGLLFLVCAIGFYILNAVSPSGYAYFRSMSMIGALGAVVLLLGGWLLVRYTWLPILFLVFAIPLPDRFYRGVTRPMRECAAWVASNLLNVVDGMQASSYGVVIDVIYKGRQVESLNVADACSGMRLLTAFLALGVAMAYLHERPIWQRMILLGSTIPIAILCNIVRVTVTGFIYVLVDPKYTKGIYHDGLGLAMLPLAFVLYWFLAWFMSGLFVEEAAVGRKDVVFRRYGS
ncbi:MAG: exosortase/archaeosortase family protein [Phycisphaerales bacterium]|nr:MAG: exosortase/archaeosortase family protein [Phycisphaerales bacterium]